MTEQRPLVSIIIDTYYRPALLREAVEALQNQTYDRIEIVIVNNAATPETVAYLHELQTREPRVRLVHFTQNQFSWDDPQMMVRTCYNAGLRASRGELIFHQADDDWVAPDFFERMVRLFVENERCTTAIGLPVSAYPDGSFKSYKQDNKRPRYMPGHELALAVLGRNGGYANPGFCFVMRRNALERAGGFHEALDIQLMFGVVPFGVTGFDPKALMYWRRHELQLNKLMTSRGHAASGYAVKLLAETDIEPRWREAFGEHECQRVVDHILDYEFVGAADVFVLNLFDLRFQAAARALRFGWKHRRFRRAVPSKLWAYGRLFPLKMLRILLRRMGLYGSARKLKLWLSSRKDGSQRKEFP